ncbi:hypothetical protein Tco_0938639 [Tanacetum coccineum]|uniref:Uncharacterized protein n=1 Tax=Tanacetum coccineum TaxID=301880 RepID=A0ABQ5DNZ8_9ASTR
MKNDNMIASGMFRINPSKTSREDKFMPINKVRESVRTNRITVLQPHLITKKDVNSITNGFSPKNVESTTRTRRPQPRNNHKSDKYVNGMKSRKKNQSANVSKSENQMKHKANVMKSKTLSSEDRLASSRPSKPRSFLSASNPQEPTNKGFPSSTSFLGGFSKLQRYDSHDVNDKVVKSIRSFVRRIIQMEKIKLFQSLLLLLLLMHPINVNNNKIQLHLLQL